MILGSIYIDVRILSLAILLTLAWYYPRNTVIPVVIPKKELFMPTGLLTMLRSYNRHIRPHNEQRKQIGLYLWSKRQPLVLSWKSQSSIPTETVFAKKKEEGGKSGSGSFFFFVTLFYNTRHNTLYTVGEGNRKDKVKEINSLRSFPMLIAYWYILIK
jgi:hypothetical protein